MTQPQNLIDRLLHTIQSWGDKTVLVIGDIMLDRFIYGSVNRISPESPVPVLAVSREKEMLGGAGNVINNLVHLGVKTKILSVAGQDDHGDQLEEKLKDLCVSDFKFIRASDRPTTVKKRYLAGHQQLLRTDYETAAPITAQDEAALIDSLSDMLKGTDAVILSDYAKGVLTQSVIKAVISQSKALNIPVLVDPKADDYAVYAGASAVTPNKKELNKATNMTVDSDTEVTQAAQKLMSANHIDAVIATRSGDGISVMRKDNASPTHFRGADIQVYDVSGAGDTVIATIGAVVSAGGSLEDAAALANMAGGIVVAKVGTAPIRKDELIDALENIDSALETGDQGAVNQEHKAIFSDLEWDAAGEVAARWKAKGLKVGFTNGCFDIVHAGHVGYLKEARARCDRLIVGLNKDSSVRVLKGPERPVHEEYSRGAVLEALASVDLVVFFGANEKGGDNTANDLINVIQPDIYFKGGDYTPEQIPETPTVRAHGGEVCVMSVFEGHSTTNSINKIKKGEQGEAA